MIGIGIENELRRKQIDKTQGEIDKMVNEIQALWQGIILKSGHLEQEIRANDIKEFAEAVRANFPGADKLLGGALLNIATKVARIFGGKESVQAIK